MAHDGGEGIHRFASQSSLSALFLCQSSPSAKGDCLGLGGQDPADEEAIGGLRWQSCCGVVFRRRAFEREGHAAAVLRWKVGCDDRDSGVSSLGGPDEDWGMCISSVFWRRTFVFCFYGNLKERLVNRSDGHFYDRQSIV
jgi:hypothetical protein